jgi:tetratricopeptide (TPR) repeat protein
MIRRKTGVEIIREEIITKLSERTDGVPLFVEEFTQMVEESGALDANQKSEDIALALNAIPVTLHDLLAARLDRLESDHDLAQLAATIGREFTYEVLQATTDLDEEALQAEVSKLVEAELLFQKGRPPRSTYIFKHALIQDAAYNSLLKQKRQQFHKRIAETLERDFQQIAATQPELLAHHYTEASQIDKAVQYWLRAGQHAQQHSANREAISHLMHGLEVLGTMEESADRDQLELGFQLTLAPVLMAARGWSAPEVGTAIERAQQLVSRFGTVEDQFFVMWGLWGWRIIRADMDICTEIADDIMQLMQQAAESSVLLPEAYWVVGCTAYYKGDFQSALDLLDEGLARNDPEHEREYALKTGQCCSLMCRSHSALALWQLGFPDQALKRADETTRLGKKLNHPFSYAMGLFFRRQVLEFTGRRDQACESIEEEYQVCHENGFVFFEVHAVFGRGDTLLRHGKVDEARKLLDQGLQMLHATGGNLSMEHPYRNIAEAFLLAGLLDDARQWLDRGFNLVNDHNERGMESEFLRLNGELALAAGDQKIAEECFQQALDVARQQHARSWELRATISFAKLRQLQGQREEAHRLLEPIYNVFTEGFDTADLLKAKSLLCELEAGA